MQRVGDILKLSEKKMGGSPSVMKSITQMLREFGGSVIFCSGAVRC